MSGTQHFTWKQTSHQVTIRGQRIHSQIRLYNNRDELIPPCQPFSIPFPKSLSCPPLFVSANFHKNSRVCWHVSRVSLTPMRSNRSTTLATMPTMLVLRMTVACVHKTPPGTAEYCTRKSVRRSHRLVRCRTPMDVPTRLTWPWPSHPAWEAHDAWCVP